ncbi:TPA: lateral flagellar basal body-associated protein LafF [Aeromonas salmonicida]|jgi:flagellar FliL protein|uniref:Flagellar protein FliL n=1 Tax=bacterium 19CA06SA08-2 TaxID=2920658 RepID=A0AAU6U702_UNCXX|nr:lateral flagellar basal body-associated protein LafF [Aeromonas salmonicida]ASI21923.1 LafF [Aeromonas salmonicida]ASI26239.1 LafF [Aeromonas salmonicida]ASI30357.1 LafF [Aeromonas salmonicida]ATD37600.1 LafF [Aeromonas salmonicida subsp. masoucida]ELI6405827.1 lateral flagellar basal body-associated protein LafF [Aeromonas salmonicida subsp. salmonicida]
MRRVMKWLMVVVMALCLLAVLAYGVYLKRDLVAVWLGLAEPKPELSATPLFKPMERFVISLEGGAESHYLVLELALVTHNPAQLNTLNELTPLIRNAMVQYFSHRTHDDVKKELQNITALQSSLLGKLVTTLQGYGYKTYLDEVLITKVLVQ